MKGLQEKTFERFLVYYIAITAQFYFGLLNHNSLPEFHNKNLPFSVALLKKCQDVLTTSTSHSTEQSEKVLSAVSKLLKYQYN